MSKFSARQERLRRSIKSASGDGILITSFHNVTYLTGFTGHDSYLLVTPNRLLLLSDPRYEEQIGDECPDLEVAIRQPSETTLDFAGDIVAKMGIRSLLVESQSLTMAQATRLGEVAPSVAISGQSNLVERLREIKDKDEIAAIRRAIHMAENAFLAVRATLTGSQTERQIAHELERLIRQLGGTGCSFSPIVGVGARAALPHGVPSDRQVSSDSFVLIDWGANEGLYLSDLTRVLVTSKIPPKFDRIYNTVLAAQRAAIDAIKPGAIMSDIDAVARKIIDDAGFGKRFGHGLGHGFGLQIHEMTRLGKGHDRPLEAGMIVTVEPGIYLPGWGGVRLEDDVLVTRDGREVLSSLPLTLEECVVKLV